MDYDFQNYVELRHDRKLLNWAQIFVTVTQCENLAFFLRIQQNIVEKDTDYTWINILITKSKCIPVLRNTNVYIYQYLCC